MKILNIRYIHTCIAVIALVIAGSGCKKAIEVGPSLANANSDNAFSSNSAAQSVVAGVFSRLSAGSFCQGINGMSINMGLAADELTTITTLSSSAGTFYANSYSALVPPGFWTEFYKVIFFCNTAIDGISKSPAVTDNVKKQLVGEMRFIRAFAFFYAVNLYGTPPLTLSVDYTVNNVMGNSGTDAVYQQILDDLIAAQAALADNVYVDANGATVTDRVRPNKQTATAMLARVYLYMGNWQKAEEQASAVIGSANYTLPALNQAFLRASRETIWALQPVTLIITNAIDPTFLIVNDAYRVSTQFPISTQLKAAFTNDDDTEHDDARLSSWVGSYTTATTPAIVFPYANKYKVSSQNSATPVSEHPVVMRLAEQYLIRAEARARQNNISGAADDLFAVRQRAGLSRSTATGQQAMLNAVMHERQVELFTEWGHRWFDLKRTNMLNTVMSTVAPGKGGTWESFKQLMPIPANDILANANLIQNQGYN